jgi:Cellulase (glycosyl hydrolase family 5)
MTRAPRLILGVLATVLLALLVTRSPGGDVSVGGVSVARGQSTPAVASPSSVQGAIDLPPDGLTLAGASYVIGWAIDVDSSDGSGVDRVSVYLDGTPVGDAHYGLPRDDIATAYGPRFRQSGWQALLDLDTLASPGAHRVEVRAHSAVSDGAEAVFTRTVNVTSPQLFCVNDHPLRFDIKRAATALDEVRANDVNTVRLDVSWASLEPNAQGTWDPVYLAKLDDVLTLAAARGVRPILVVVGTPAWARNGTGSVMTPPTQPETYAAALGMLAARYANHPGMVYEVWNEPNQHQFWDSPNGRDPAGYTDLLRSAYASIKANAPAATVLGGSIAFNDPSYLQAMYDAGAAGNFDGLALHPYSGNKAPDDTSDSSRSFVLALDQAQQILTAHGEANKPIWVTEMGWSLSDVADQTRADFLRQSVDIVRARPNVAAFCAYTLDETSDDADFGLVHVGGAATTSWLSYGRAVAQR